MDHIFRLKGVWNGGRNSSGTIESGLLKTEISIPEPMGGPGIGTNPDEMLLGAAATCYIITLAAMLERSSIGVDSLTLDSEGTVDVTNNIFTYKSIVHRPLLLLAEGQSEEIRAKAEKLALKAESSCMITRALAGNVEVSAEPVVNIAQKAL
ncbi:OsmC family protein [Saccharibacillus sp. CPCC 101409]|uniref:OsmC family protein n=1 Tax=Saccharibacillus sp. CPCC 101409 TaxID=3058041 RepID=UPI0026735346|nr:OsmC family protein [Saccharibacillus sp. CPCC 101409]MDO3409488.1 OsmC family protein [Saccharibacillus sp. CPCC 101409]